MTTEKRIGLAPGPKYKICSPKLKLQLHNCLTDKSNEVVKLSGVLGSTDEKSKNEIKEACPNFNFGTVNGNTFTAHLPVDQVVKLSNLSCVRRLEGSSKMRLC